MKSDVRNENYDYNSPPCSHVAFFLHCAVKRPIYSCNRASTNHGSVTILSGDLLGVLERNATERERERDRLGEREI